MSDISTATTATVQTLIPADTTTQTTTETPISVVPPRSPQAYYQQLAAVPIETVTRELLAGHITSEGHGGRGEILCNCPHHDSSSKKSLTISPAKQQWFCFGCGVGGGVLQLVEFVQSGKFTTKLDNDANGRRPESHRKARDWLAPHAGLPPLSAYGLSSAQISETEQNHFRDSRSLECLTACARWYHEKLISAPDVLAWWLEKTKLSLDTITEQKIGYADNYGLPAHLRELGFTDDEIISTGLLDRDHSGVVTRTTFEHKITLPYWTCGHVHYMIARECPWTKTKDIRGPKYQKLKAYNEHTQKQVSPAIKNNRLHNEDILSTELPYVVITEGITDNLSGIEHGFPCVSPVTVSIRSADWPRLIPKFSKVRTVYLIGDNEVSKAGLEGSLKIAAVLKKNKITPRIVILPLRDDQRQAREIIAEQWGITDHLDKAEITRKKAEIPDDELDEYKRLTDLAKVDLNAYFADGHTAADLQALLDSAPTPTEFAIDRLNIEDPDLENEIKPILRGIAEHDILDTDALINQVREKIGLKIPKKVLQDQVKAYRKEQKSSIRVATRQSTATVTAPDGTLRNVVQKMRAEALQNRRPLEPKTVAEAMWEWLMLHGAVAIVDAHGHKAVHFNSRVYYTNSANREQAADWRALLFELADLLQKNTEDAKITEALGHIINNGSKKQFGGASWLYTDQKRFTVYFDLCNDRGEIVKITPGGVEVLSNGNNTDRVFLQTTPNMFPINYDPNVDHATAFARFKEIISKLTCSERDKHMISSWLLCFLLIDFSSTKPVARFEGATGSGKSAAGDALTCLLYGEPLQQKVTVAAAWALSRISPLLCLDNVEKDNQTTALKDFVLLAATGATNTKRRTGTDSETVDEKPHCLQISSGIEAWFAELPEITNRCFVFEFFKKNHSASFVEHEFHESIKEHRDAILSFIIQRTSQVLRKLADGQLGLTKQLIVEKFPGHNKERANEYLSLMSVLEAADDPAAPPSIPHEIEQWLVHQTNAAIDVSAEDSPIVNGLSMLFGKCGSSSIETSQTRDEFYKKYCVNFSTDEYGRTRIGPATSAELYAALTTVCREHAQTLKIPSTSTLGRSINGGIEVLRSAGFAVTTRTGGKRKRFYTVTKLRDDEDGAGLTDHDGQLEDAPF